MNGSDNRFLRALLNRFAGQADAVFCHQVGAHGEHVILWGDLAQSCAAFGEAYGRSSLARGGQVLIFLRHVPELYGSFFGAMLSGLTPAFMPCSSPRQDLGLYWRSHAMLLDQIRPAAIVTDEPTLAEMRSAGLDLGSAAVILIETVGAAPLAPRWADEQAIALLQHSSGTTGLKKGVALSYAAIVDQIESYAAVLGLNEHDAIISWLPLYHDMGLIACLMMPAYFGIPITHIDPLHWVGRPGLLFDQIVARGGTLTWLPNFAFDHLSATVGRRAAQWDLSGMRAFINCSEPCKAASLDRFAAAFAPAAVRPDQLQCCYAMAETVFAVSQTRLGESPRRLALDPASLVRGARPQASRAVDCATLIETGAVIDGLRVTIHDEAGNEIAEDRVGEIGVRGRFLFSGYNRDPRLTAERLRGDLYLTRDLGFLRDERVYILGRLDDLIIINGRNMYAHEIEAAVAGLDGVKAGRCVALAWFDARIGSETLVLMCERDRASPCSDDDLRRRISETVNAIFNVMPRAVELVEEGRLVKTTSGKLSRSENLRRFVQSRVAGETSGG